MTALVTVLFVVRARSLTTSRDVRIATHSPREITGGRDCYKFSSPREVLERERAALVSVRTRGIRRRTRLRLVATGPPVALTMVAAGHRHDDRDRAELSAGAEVRPPTGARCGATVDAARLSVVRPGDV